jgi:hypothetical protein
MNIIAILLRAIAAFALCFAFAAHAGQACEQKKMTPRSVERALRLAEQTMETLDASGQQVVLLARAGQDLTRYGLHYSHLGFAYRQPDGNGGHVWRILHKLNQCGTAVSAIYRQGLGEFFLDDLWRYEAAFVAPTADAQQKLLSLLQDNRAAVRLHHRPYSIVSYAWGTRYQQSNQWAIETFALAMSNSIRTREEAQGWLQYMGYRPGVLTLDPLTRLGGRISAANVAFDDHPVEKRFSDHIETVTVESVFDWLLRTGLGSEQKTVSTPLRPD